MLPMWITTVTFTHKHKVTPSFTGFTQLQHAAQITAAQSQGKGKKGAWHLRWRSLWGGWRAATHHIRLWGRPETQEEENELSGMGRAPKGQRPYQQPTHWSEAVQAICPEHTQQSGPGPSKPRGYGTPIPAHRLSLRAPPDWNRLQFKSTRIFLSPSRA